MSKKLLKVSVILIALFIFCIFLFYKLNRDSNSQKTVEYIKKLNGYTCDMEMTITSDNGMQTKYNIKCTYDKKVGYTVEIDGKLFENYMGDKIIVEDTQNNLKYELQDSYNNPISFGFLPRYLDLMYSDKHLNMYTKVFEERKYDIIEQNLFIKNTNMNKAMMIFDNKSHFPLKLIIFDKNESEKIKILYSNFAPI